MRLKRFFLIFILLSCSLFVWKLWTTQVDKFKNLKTEILYNISEQKKQLNNNQLIHVKTDVMDIKINLYNGEIYQSRLLNYQEKLTSLKKLELINHDNLKKNTVNSEIWYKIGTSGYIKNIQYSINNTDFKLLNGQKVLFVRCIADTNNGMHIEKIFIFKHGSYDIGIEYKICNHSKSEISYRIFGSLKQKNIQSHNNTHSIHNQFQDFACSKNFSNYKEYSLFDILHKKESNYISQGGWIALLQKYFVISWILDKSDENTVYITHDHHSNVTIWYKMSNIVITPGSKVLKRTILWIGPKIQNKMSYIAPYFSDTINYGWFWFLSKPLFNLLNILHYFLNNWGYAIIFITCIIRCITYPLIKAQYIATIKMKSLQPEINYIKKKFNDNKKKLNSKILKLYKKNNINPLSGLLPVLLQMPIFLALYYMLVNAVELRHAPFIFWIYDLSAQDPLYILPILMGITIFFMQKTAPTNYFPLSLQEKIINFAPIFFVCFFLWFPAGLVLYYIVSNVVTIIQQIIIHRSLKGNIKFQ
ncbi:membrane protein insertase YidC [Buchnera aphidicola]|uniref:Membrane protein insertase YidC n=1 Tax=Buchnera aphidicola (Sarucallis kahawaluokalani) TaxID=1241878 RepID=A0A4D6Y7F7_9GAMM|nr:membrane protein insertase YidC [Buchnera aphidicola]QCI25826.1 membrane protein insertase YidC [Buchnera aphidicola (Sarucallis kahawaluokalani)]